MVSKSNDSKSKAPSDSSTKPSDESLSDLVLDHHLARLGLSKSLWKRYKDRAYKFADKVGQVENSGKLTGKNPKSSARGKYQITADTLDYATKKLKGYEGLSGKNFKNIEDAIKTARQPHSSKEGLKGANALNEDEQTALFFANIFERGKDPYLTNMLKGDVRAERHLYTINHHTVSGETEEDRKKEVQTILSFPKVNQYFPLGEGEKDSKELLAGLNGRSAPSYSDPEDIAAGRSVASLQDAVKGYYSNKTSFTLSEQPQQQQQQVPKSMADAFREYFKRGKK